MLIGKKQAHFKEITAISLFLLSDFPDIIFFFLDKKFFSGNINHSNIYFNNKVTIVA